MLWLMVMVEYDAAFVDGHGEASSAAFVDEYGEAEGGVLIKGEKFKEDVFILIQEWVIYEIEIKKKEF